jgi:hypothetical protein
MGDELDDLVLGDAVLEGALEMAAQLLAAIERDQRRDGDQAAVALLEVGPLPDIAEQHLLGQVDQLGRDGANLVAGRGGRLRAHDRFLLAMVRGHASASTTRNAVRRRPRLHSRTYPL